MSTGKLSDGAIGGEQMYAEEAGVEQVAQEYVAAQFEIDALEHLVFNGWTDGSTWNGWACPWFAFAETVRVLSVSAVNGYVWRYDEKKDVFTVQHPDEADLEPERYEGKDLMCDGVIQHAYPIGAWMWTWDEVEGSV